MLHRRPESVQKFFRKQLYTDLLEELYWMSDSYSGKNFDDEAKIFEASNAVFLPR